MDFLLQHHLFLLEWFSAAGMILSVYLTVKRNIWCWPLGFVMVCIATYVFYQYRLYSDVWLHVVYAVLQLYGWYSWLFGGEENTPLKVRRLDRLPLMAGLGLGLVGTFAVGYWFATRTDADIPYLDAATSVFAVVAQVIMARKFLECWVFWFFINIAGTSIYLYKGMYAYSILYAIFLVLAVMGYLEWRRVLQGREAD